ncbi:MAG: type II toxin-antitoxin system HicA family toxin [Candidatus Aenigmarchaeota archaeon]|nr:type II toxin-antitoxin system HicA family toxin [Candidatus Aenigmarchaeota archaeon]
MHKLKPVSGSECIKILCNKFGFKVVRQRGSHVVLRKNGVGTVVPNHKEVNSRTLKSVLKLAKVSEEEFAKHL